MRSIKVVKVRNGTDYPQNKRYNLFSIAAFNSYSKNKIPTSLFLKTRLSLRESNNPKGLDKRSNERHSDGVIANHPVT